ncbi:response regulator transcription factor [Clostridium botulinum]
MEYKIMIVEDDITISTLLKEHIEKYGFKVKVVENFGKVMEDFQEYKPHIMLLDVNLPKYDGYYWCKKIRQDSNIPVLFISARESEMDQVMALESGADDYITKPFYYEVVMAKIKSHLRRCYGSYALKLEEKILEVEGLKYYTERLEAKFKETSVVLTKNEGILLECLMKKYPRVVMRDYLLEQIWNVEAYVEDNTLTVNVTRLRKRLQDIGINEAVEAVRSMGYRLNKTWEEK